ncbi:fungal-specific transcription factor domain-containing protein [Lipomyces tetrasporus]|uniref:Fungal-specific transcription factor domain-containing protein n=1 Tax=Lipomyces tetrasporus TaxID=54092 RepID=A0AAD7QXW3_9ASCO|nr:fungal-specific transcription factor domain-containing protein [Lipomyces tetrasporus]KAJ8103444.1 fungal-specific transcription factor domain-containing protein [Lipomyces tetrasporus]
MENGKSQKADLVWVDESKTLLQNKPQTSTGGLHFINKTVSSRTSTTEERTIVRKHVMRDFRQKQLKSAAGKAKGLESSVSLRTSPSRTIAAGRIDPFRTMGFEVRDCAAILLEYYRTGAVRSMIPVWPSATWLSYAMEDAALLYATLLHASFFFSASGIAEEEMIMQTILLYRGQTIKALNGRLRLEKEQVKDTTVAAVACMLTYEVLNGDLSTAEIHVNGLMELLRRKGGVSSDEMGGVLHKLVSWSILCSSIALQSNPQGHLVQTDERHMWIGAQPRLSGVWNTTENEFYEIPALQKDVDTVFSYLPQLSSMKLEFQKASAGTPEESLVFAERMSFAEQAIARLLYASSQIDQDDAYGSLARSFGLASTIYLYTVLREIPVGLFIIGNLVGRLKTALDVDFVYGLPQWANKLLWILVVGSLAAIGRPEQSWFIGRLSAWCGICSTGIEDAVDIVVKESCWPVAKSAMHWNQRLAELVCFVSAEINSADK